MNDFVSNGTSPTPILNYSTDDELSSTNLAFTTGVHQALLANVIIENETILSKNTNESLSEVMDQLSLLRGFEQDNIADKYDVSQPSRLEYFNPENQDQLLYETTNSSFLTSDSEDFDDNLCCMYQEDSLYDVDNSYILLPDTYKKVSKRNQLMKVRKYKPSKNFEDIQCSNVTNSSLNTIDIMDVKIINFKNTLQSYNATGSIVDMNGQSDSRYDLFIASIVKNNIISSAINDTVLHKNVKFHSNCDEVSFIDNMENYENELEIRKNFFFKNKLKEYETQIYDLLLKKELTGQLINGSTYNLSKNILIDNGILNIFNDSDNESRRVNIAPNNSTNYYTSENRSIHNNIRKKSSPSDMEDVKMYDKSYENIEELFTIIEKNNSLDIFNDSMIRKTRLRNSTECLQNKKCYKVNFKIEKVFNKQEIINDINSKSANETIKKKNEISANSTKIYNKNERKRLNIYSCKNFSICSKIKYVIADIRENKLFPNREQCIIFNNKGFCENTDFYNLDKSEDSLEFEENSADLVKNVSERISARLRKGPKPKSNIKKCIKLPKNEITEKDIRNIVYSATLKNIYIKSTYVPQKKTIKKQLGKKDHDGNIKFRLRHNSQNVSSKPNIKQHVKITNLRKFILSKFPSSLDILVSMDCEDLIEKINIIINRIGCKRVNVNILLSEFKMLLYDYNICKTVIEFYTFIMNYTPVYFQKKIIPLGGAFGCNAPSIHKNLSDTLMYS